MKSEEQLTREELRGAGRLEVKPAPLASALPSTDSSALTHSKAARDSSAAVARTTQTQRQSSLGVDDARGRAGKVVRKGGRQARAHEPLSHEGRVLLMTLAAGAPAVLGSLVLLWVGGYTPKVFWTLGVLIGCFWLGFSFTVQGRVVRPLQTVSNLLASLREGDY